MERLSTVAPELAGEIRSTTDERALRGAARRAAEIVMRRAELADGRVERALKALADGRTDGDLRRSLEELVTELDERAWDLQDAYDEGRAEKEHYLAAFAKARACGAVVAALHPDATIAALEATYEAHCAFADGSGVLDAVAATVAGAEGDDV